MNRWVFINKLVCSATVLLLCALVPHAHGQDGSDESEVYLAFQYRGVVGVYVTTYYKNNDFYLPVNELFNQLQINHQVNQGTLTISGNYLGDKPFVINFKKQTARSGDTQIQLRAEDFLIKEIDYFLKPEIFQKLFGLNFTTDFNNLTLDLETNDKMPVVAQYEREQKRKQLDRKQPIYTQSHYPLKYGREYGTVDGAFLDYNISGIYTNNSKLLSFSNAIGAEFLGGDVQGNIFGAISDRQSALTTSGLRWRFVQRDNPFFSSAIAGQTNTEGISSRSITGFKISNKPIEPRLLFDRYVIDGDVAPQSEVELYLNNRLIDYQEADNSGTYRFVVPLTYGSTNYSVRVYTPAGQAFERNSRIQIPFDYLPPGQVDYTISGGRLSNPILGSTDRGYVGEATVSTGVSEWLTAQVSSEYLTNYHHSLPSITGTLNARLFSNYLLSANINSENFYRLTSSVVYNNGASWNVSYDYNPGNSRIYNIGGYDHQARVSLFTPFRIGTTPLNIRWSSTYQKTGLASLLRYRTDFNTRLGRLNIRLGYQDQQIGDLSWETTAASRLTNSYTYSMGRYHSIPSLLRGMFIRGQLTYLPGLKEFEEMEFQLSRDIRETGRIQFTFGHNFIGDFNSLSLNLTLDFNKIRSSTTSRTSGTDMSVTQNFRGSIGYDPYGDQLLLHNRQQVGQSGAAVRLFVDNNNDGTFEDSTDHVITDPAIRLNRAGGRTDVKNGINYVSQLLPYYQYDIEINKNALSNPLLVPDVENFSIITDPNQYKTVEIPFYQSGVISGKVEQKKGNTLKGLGGLRLHLQSNYDKKANRKPFNKELRTFSDGSFYTYEVPPGSYHLFIDPDQLQFLDAISEPDTMDIKIRSLAEGDFIEDLNFTIIPKGDTTKVTEPSISQNERSPAIKEQEDVNPSRQGDNHPIASDEKYYYEIQLASFKTLRKAEQVAAEASKRLGGSFSVTLNTNNGLYAIRSAPIPKRGAAVETIISYHNSSYSSAALVLLQNRSKPTNVVQPKFIQIGAYSTIERARKFANSSANELNQEIAITHNRKTNLYKVYVNESYSSEEELEKRLAKIKNIYSYSNAYINKNNHIQIGAFKTRYQANVFTLDSEKILRQKIAISHDRTHHHYNVFIDENFRTNEKLQKALAKVQTTAPFKDAFVFNTAKNEDIKEKSRPMQFTYKVQVEGVTDESEQAFLSSALSGDSDSDLQRPQKDVVIFDDVETWQKAQSLQRKLRKVSTIGHPIVILIEKSPTRD